MGVGLERGARVDISVEDGALLPPDVLGRPEDGIVAEFLGGGGGGSGRLTYGHSRFPLIPGEGGDGLLSTRPRTVDVWRTGFETKLDSVGEDLEGAAA